MKYATLAIGCALASALLSRPARADEPAGEPTGVGEVKFGMSPDDVKKLYPDLKLTMSPSSPTAGQPAIGLSIYTLREQKLGKLTCNIDMKFLVDKLSYLDFYCGEKKDVPAYLEATYGKPVTRADDGWMWKGPKITVSYAPAIGTFSVVLKRANDALQGDMFLYQLMQGQGQPGQAQQAPAQK